MANQSISKTGYLEKQSKYIKKYRKRKVVLKNGILKTYDTVQTYDQQLNSEPTSTFDLIEYNQIKKTSKYQFKLSSAKHSQLFLASSEQKTQEWVNALSQAILNINGCNVSIYQETKENKSKLGKYISDRLSMEGQLNQARESLNQFLNPTYFGKELDNNKEYEIPQSILRKAKGIVFLTVIKAGFLFGINGGTGCVIVKCDNNKWSAPSSVGIGGISAGFLAGASKVDYMLILPNQSAVNRFKGKGQLTLGGELELAVGPLGRNGAASVTAGVDEVSAIYSYSHSKGLYGGLELDGKVIAERIDCNKAFYKKSVKCSEILNGDVNDEMPYNADYAEIVKLLNNAIGANQMSIESIDKQSFIETSKAKMNHYASFPTLTDYSESKSNEINSKKVTEFTQNVLSKKPSGDPTQRDTLLHVLNGIAKINGKKCLFFDSSKGINSDLTKNSYLNVIDGNDEKAPKFVVTLNNLDQFVDEKDEKQYDKTEKLLEMKQALTDDRYNPIIDDVRKKLATAHNVSPERIVINDIYENGVGVAYHVTDLTINEKNKIITESKQLESKMRKLFNDYKKCAIHPALLHNSYDISMFDERGNKTFTSGSTYKVGPTGKEREYIQPTGWTRYGLKVLGKYDNDKWLHPFQDNGNWYRAYHGTSREAGSNIYKTEFKMGGGVVYGEGIYSSPNIDTARGYSRKIKIETNKGTKSFYYVLQVAVNPDTMNNAALIKDYNSNNPHYIVPTGADIRPYGILIKEV